MKNAMPYIYLIMGFLIGFVIGATSQEASGFPIGRLGYFLVAVVVILLYMWLEKTSHSRHISKWQSHRKKGRLYFILSYYIGARAVPILLIFILPVSFKVNLTGDSVEVLILTGIIALAVFGLLGRQEWARCQADFSVQALKETSERAKDIRSHLPGSGV